MILACWALPVINTVHLSKPACILEKMFNIDANLGCTLNKNLSGNVCYIQTLTCNCWFSPLNVLPNQKTTLVSCFKARPPRAWKVTSNHVTAHVSSWRHSHLRQSQTLAFVLDSGRQYQRKHNRKIHYSRISAEFTTICLWMFIPPNMVSQWGSHSGIMKCHSSPYIGKYNSQPVINHPSFPDEITMQNATCANLCLRQILTLKSHEINEIGSFPIK